MVTPLVPPVLTELNNLPGFPPKNAFELGDYLNQIVAALGGGGGAPDVQVFTTPGAITWTKPVGKTLCDMIAIGGGAGGGSGATGAAGTLRLGGGGGGGGGYATVKGVPLSVLGATESGNVGGGGIGGISAPMPNSPGIAGSPGGPTYLGVPNPGTPGKGPWVIVGGSSGGQGGGTGLGGSGGFSTLEGSDGGSSADGASTPGQDATFTAATGGGAGGPISALDVAQDGTHGGDQNPNGFGGPGGTIAPPALPVAGSGYGTNVGIGGFGGGGGAASITAAAQAGANGGGYGGGGGGGGAALNGFAAGKGGDGSPGILIVISY